jgi:hypothetical protein
MRTAPLSARYDTDICPRSASISPGNRSSEWRYRFESPGHICGSTSFPTNVSRTGCWRAPVSEREPIVTEREPVALLVVSEREPKSRAVCEPGGLCLQAATLMFQQVLEQPGWLERMLPEDLRALSPLIYHHVNPYGTFKLDMAKRLPIDLAEAA